MNAKNNTPQRPHFPAACSRREMLFRAGAGFGGMALSWMLAQEASAQTPTAAPRRTLPDLAPRPPMFPARARSVIFLFMVGGPSHVDTFDYKPKLNRSDGQTLQNGGALMASPYTFKPYGQSGHYVSEIFSNVGAHVDDICFLHSMKSANGNHAPAVFEMNTGNVLPGHPSLGSWITYGLGTENQKMPAYVVLTDGGIPTGGAPNWSNGFLPAIYQGTRLRSKGSPILDLQHVERDVKGTYTGSLNYLNQVNTEHLAGREGDSELQARIASYRLAYQMQMEAPKVTNVGEESAATQALYGINRKESEAFGRQCLLARRLVESGVRFVQLFCGTNGGWDAHNNLAKNHRDLAARCDRPIAGLLTDLKQRRMLDDTLVVWGGEFGRTPESDNKDGRNHHPGAHTVWMAGGGVRGGSIAGQSDELGRQPASGSYGMHDLHATILHAMGLNDLDLTYLYNGRYQRLTETGGQVIKSVFG